jgi:predicted transposase YdaD
MQIDRQTGRQAGRQEGRQAGRQADIVMDIKTQRRTRECSSVTNSCSLTESTKITRSRFRLPVLQTYSRNSLLARC